MAINLLALNSFLSADASKNKQKKPDAYDRASQSFESVFNNTDKQKLQPRKDKSVAVNRAKTASKAATTPKDVEKPSSDVNENAATKAKSDAQNASASKKSTETAENNKADKSNKAEKTNSKDNLRNEDLKNEDLQNSVDAANDDIAQRIAKILNIPVEEVTQILNSLNMTAMDLTDKAALSEFMQKVFDATGPVQLLNVPGIGRMMEEAGKAAGIYSDLALRVTELTTAESQGLSLEGFTEMQSTDENLQATIDAVMQRAVNNADLSDVPGKEALVGNEQSLRANDNADAARTSQTQNNQITDVVKLYENEAAKAGTFSNFNEDSSSHQDNTGQRSFDSNAVFTGNVNTSQTSTVNTFAAVRAEAARSTNTEDVINQIMDRIKVDVKGGVSEIKMILRPEQLGDVTLKVSFENGVITAQFLAENQRVKEIIEANFTQLKNSLQQQGLEVSDLSVAVDQNNAQNDQQRNMESFMRNGQAAVNARRVQHISGAEVEETEEVVTDSSVAHEGALDYTV